METGLVKWFNNAKGWGFIAGRDGSDVFVHYSQISGDGYRTLREGQQVAYDLSNELRPSGSRSNVLLEIESPANFRHRFVEICKRLAVGHFVPHVEHSGGIYRISHLDHFGQRFSIPTVCRLLSDFFAHAPEELLGMGRGRIGALSPRREQHGQLVRYDDANTRVHDVKANALGDLELSGMGAVNFDACIRKGLLDVLNRQRSFQPIHEKPCASGRGRYHRRYGRCNSPALWC